MLRTYHRLITTQALSEYFSPRALEVIISANLGQDHWLHGQIGHPEYHFDQNAFLESWDYIKRSRAVIRTELETGQAFLAQQALGRLTHAAQDFYAHTNYVTLWLERFPDGQRPPPDEMDAFDEVLLRGADLLRDSHAWMNLDSPARAPGFAYAFSAAVQRTRYEYELTVSGLPSGLISLLCMNQT